MHTGCPIGIQFWITTSMHMGSPLKSTASLACFRCQYAYGLPNWNSSLNHCQYAYGQPLEFTSEFIQFWKLQVLKLLRLPGCSFFQTDGDVTFPCDKAVPGPDWPELQDQPRLYVNSYWRDPTDWNPATHNLCRLPVVAHRSPATYRGHCGPYAGSLVNRGSNILYM